MFRIRIDLNTDPDPDPAFKVNTDLDPDSDPGFYMTKMYGIFFLKYKNSISSLKLL